MFGDFRQILFGNQLLNVFYKTSNIYLELIKIKNFVLFHRKATFMERGF